MSGFLGCGTLYFDRKIGGVWQGYKELGNASKCEIKENSELKERISKQCATYGIPLDSITVKRPAEFSASLDEINADNMALAFLGTASDRTIASGTVTAEIKTVVTLDSMLQTDLPNISALVVTTTDDITTYTVDVDYEIVNASIGLIKILSTGAITAAMDIKFAYTNGDVTSTKVSGGTDSNIKLRLLLIGTNLADDTAVQVKAWEVALAPQNGVDFLADDFVSIDIGGTMNLDASAGNAYEVYTDVVNT